MHSYVLEHRVRCYSKGEGILIPPVFDPDALNIHGTYVVNNHGEELKAKAPPYIWLYYVLDWNCHRWYIGTCGIHIKLWHHVNVHLN